MKKLLSLTLVIMMLFSTVSINVSASTTPSDWAVNEVNNAKNAGIITNAITKNYQKDITREEFCELVVKLYEKLTNQSATVGTDIFTDTDNQEILKAYNLGIVKGVSSNQFAPYNNITRQEICVMLVRCIDIAIESADISDFNNNNFADKNKIADWAIDYVNYAYDNGVMKGVGNNCIDPLGNATCEQSVLLAYRIYSTYAQSDVAYEVEIENIETDQETDISYVNNIVIILFKDSASQEDRDEVVSAINGKVVGRFDTINQYQVQVKTSTLNELIDMCDTVNEYDCVLTATYDIATQVSTDAMITPNDKWNNDNWNERNPSGNNWWLEVIQAPSAWSYNDKLGNIKIGIVDNGFDTGHEDLKNKLSFAAQYNKDVNNKEDHGSHVAGIIGATANNNKGITGIVWNSELVCYDWEPSWLQSKVGGWSTSTAIAAGLIETVKSGSKVVNFSLGCTASLENNNSTYSQEWIDAQGHNASMYMASLLSQGYDFVVVQSAGNGASDGIGVDAIFNGWFSSITRNNCYDNLNTVNDILDRIIIVGAAEQNNGTYRQASFSNGGNLVDICAPGVDVYSTITGGIAGKYGNMSGTSMAAPIVAGVAGLVWSADSNLTGAEVKDIVCDTENSKITVADNTSSRNAVGTYKMVNAKLSVEDVLDIGLITYLDELSPISGDRYTGNEGDSFIDTIGKRNGNIDVNGNEYNHGLTAWVARWNYTDEISWVWNEYDINGEYEYLQGDIVLIKSYNENNFRTKIQIIGDGDVLYEKILTPSDLPIKNLKINISDVDKLKISVKDLESVSGGTAFGLADFRLTTGKYNSNLEETPKYTIPSEIYMNELSPISSDRYTGNEGDSFIDTIGKRNGNVDINGNEYNHGLTAWVARWNYTDEISWVWNEYDINGEYEYLQGDIVLIKSYNENNFRTKIQIIGDGDVLYEKILTPSDLPIKNLRINVSDVDKLKISVKDLESVSGGTAFGLADFKLTK